MIRPRTIRLVAGFDLYESLRSRKAIALIALYTIGAIAGSAFFIEGLNYLTSELHARVGQDMTDAMLESEELLDVVADLVRDRDVAKELLSIPPLALFYGWLATNFMPLVVVLTSSDVISGPVATGSVRYTLFRADRLDWALGKLAGQTLLMAVGILVGGIASFGLGAVFLDFFDPLPTFWWTLIMCGRALFYAFAYLGVSMCASMLVKSNAAARALGIGMVFLLSVGGSLIQSPWIYPHAPDVFDVIKQIFPNGHSLSIFHPSFLRRALSMIGLVRDRWGVLLAGLPALLQEGRMTESALTVTGLRKVYGKNIALDGMDFSIPKGVICGFIGANGAGKTTTFGIVGGLIGSDAGAVDILGRGALVPHRDTGRVTMLPQDCELTPHVPVVEYLRYLARLQGMTKAEAHKAADSALDGVALKERATSKIKQLSHGMRRRVSVAQALLGDPELVLLDEPTSGLDPELVIRMREVFAAQRGKRTLVISSHNLRELEAVCDHVIFIQKGRCVRVGSIDEVTQRGLLMRYLVEKPFDLVALRQQARRPIVSRASVKSWSCRPPTAGPPPRSMPPSYPSSSQQIVASSRFTKVNPWKPRTWRASKGNLPSAAAGRGCGCERGCGRGRGLGCGRGGGRGLGCGRGCGCGRGGGLGRGLGGGGGRGCGCGCGRGCGMRMRARARRRMEQIKTSLTLCLGHP